MFPFSSWSALWQQKSQFCNATSVILKTRRKTEEQSPSKAQNCHDKHTNDVMSKLLEPYQEKKSLKTKAKLEVLLAFPEF